MLFESTEQILNFLVTELVYLFPCFSLHALLKCVMIGMILARFFITLFQFPSNDLDIYFRIFYCCYTKVTPIQILPFLRVCNLGRQQRDKIGKDEYAVCTMHKTIRKTYRVKSWLYNTTVIWNAPSYYGFEPFSPPSFDFGPESKVALPDMTVHSDIHSSHHDAQIEMCHIQNSLIN